MTVIESLKHRARFLAAGFLSFLVILAAMRWSQGEALLQPAADLGLVVGFVFVAAFFVANDVNGARGSSPRGPRLP
jgi:Na+-translocating ferredoxin:NAD+ oxidoreductase RnfD subunit